MPFPNIYAPKLIFTMAIVHHQYILWYILLPMPEISIYVWQNYFARHWWLLWICHWNIFLIVAVISLYIFILLLIDYILSKGFLVNAIWISQYKAKCFEINLLCMIISRSFFIDSPYSMYLFPQREMLIHEALFYFHIIIS